MIVPLLGGGNCAAETAKRATHKLPATILPLPRPSTRPRASILFQQRATVPWSFTDCTSKTIIDNLGITTLLAPDDHFRQLGLNIHLWATRQLITPVPHRPLAPPIIKLHTPRPPSPPFLNPF